MYIYAYMYVLYVRMYVYIVLFVMCLPAAAVQAAGPLLGRKQHGFRMRFCRDDSFQVWRG